MILTNYNIANGRVTIQWEKEIEYGINDFPETLLETWARKKGYLNPVHTVFDQVENDSMDNELKLTFAEFKEYLDESVMLQFLKDQTL